MDEKLKEFLEQFKKYTIEMIENLQSDKLDVFEDALKNRQKILDQINELKFNKSEFKALCEELNIIEMNNKLNNMTKEEKDKVKSNIVGLKKSQRANNAYNYTMDKSTIFSKEV